MGKIPWYSEGLLVYKFTLLKTITEKKEQKNHQKLREMVYKETYS